MTDELVAMAEEVSPSPDPREMDMLLSTGERISCALAAMVINDLGHEAISLTGSQAGIVTDTVHGKAKIVDVRARRINEALDQDRIVLVAGFQGVSADSRDVQPTSSAFSVRVTSSMSENGAENTISGPVCTIVSTLTLAAASAPKSRAAVAPSTR